MVEALAYDSIMRTILMALATACGGGVSGEDPHAPAVCPMNGNANDGRAVELACVKACGNGDISTGPGCMATAVLDDGSDFAVTCSDSLTFEGRRGCCIVDTAADQTVHFAECQ